MLALKPFSSIPTPVEVKAYAAVKGSRWAFEFELKDPGGAVLDSLEEGRWRNWARADGLWRSTCFEAFVGLNGEPGYWEFNFSPAKKAWNAYRFENYREPQPPKESGDFELEEVTATKTRLQCTLLAKTEKNLSLECSLTAVIRTAAGTSYFALTHAAEKADFHKRASFSLRL